MVSLASLINFTLLSALYGSVIVAIVVQNPDNGPCIAKSVGVTSRV